MMVLNKSEKIESILSFVKRYPESTASLKISRETMGEAPLNFGLGHLSNLRLELEVADDWVVDGYFYLVK